ncbi:diguanylate cyclase [Actinoplanes sp. NPDC023801]|uniref:diguanylate cyclase n=1 Tax=Actinoplanes sp. NPDC023801 TaxID=3154595 RepID=UPI0033C91185
MSVDTRGSETGRQAAELTGLEIEAELGRGAATTVHRARRGGQWYALKRPRGEAGDDPQTLLAFCREAALLACVNDPGVVTTMAAGRYEGTPALVTEFIDGGSLAELLVNGPLPQWRVVELAAVLARALGAAHRTGLVHRDVKPQNIMMGSQGSAKLIDFGLALLGRAPDDTDEAVGTFVYTAPEQSGMLKRPVDGRSDLYSLGVVLFECLTGQPPFDAADVGELLRLHAVAPVPSVRSLRPDADPVLAEVVERLLAKDPDDRYQSPGALLTDLRRCPGSETLPVADDATAGMWPLCGREPELATLMGRWERAGRGVGGGAVIRGAAGTGRSRLAAEMCTRVIGAAVLRGRCVQDEVLPMAALRAAVDDHLDAIAAMPDDEHDVHLEWVREAAVEAGAGLLAGVSPRLAELLGDTGGGTEGRDELMFSAVAVFLSRLARSCGGLLLCLDDAQWLDAGSRRVLNLLGPMLAQTPLLVLLTELDGADGPVTELGAKLDTEVRCEPLAADAVAELVASRLPGATVPAGLLEHVAARTGGPPLAVVAYLLQLVDAGLLVPLWGEWYLDTVGVDALPAAADAEALIVSRLGMLTGEVRWVVQAGAVTGSQFRHEVVAGACGLPVDRVLDALTAAVGHRVLELRDGGRYGFVHAALRQALLGELPEQDECRLHAALGAALEELPAQLRDDDHVYAVARHYRSGGEEVAPEVHYRAARAAGMQALAEHSAAGAIDYLEHASRNDVGRPSDILHPLAVAYLRAGRYADAQDALERALAVEQDSRRRAELGSTLVELHHTNWADDHAVRAATAALADLGHPLPAGKVPRLASTLAIAAMGGLVRRTRLGYGTARGDRREELATLAAVLDAGGYAAAIGLRLREALIFALRALYAVNRLGPSAQYARVYALIGYVAAVVKLRGVAERSLRRATRTAAALNDPELIAYVEWFQGCALLFGGFDDGSAWERAIVRHARWFLPAQLITGFASTGLRLIFRGHTPEASEQYARGMRHLPDPRQAYGTPFSMLSVMVPAQQGRPAEAATALAALRESFPPGVGSPVQRASIATAAACAVVEQGEFGAPLEEAIAEFEGLGLSNRDLMPQHKWFYVYKMHGRMAQLRMSTDEERPARVAAAKKALRELAQVTGTPLLKAAYRVAKAALWQQCGDNRKALALADRVERRARSLDAPILTFEVARIRARALRQMGLSGEAERQARFAHMLAATYGWEHRRRQIKIEFGVDEARSVQRHTHVDRRTSVARNRRFEALQQVSAAAATVLDPEQLARVALDETLRILGAERALMFLLDETGAPSFFVGRNADGTEADTTTGYGSTLVRRVVENGEALVITGTEQGLALGSHSVVAHGLRSIMVAPLQLKGRLSGVVYLDSRMARGIFTEDDIEVLTAITSHVAVSLETARAAQLDVAVRAAQQQQQLAETLRASLAELSAVLDPPQVLHRLFATLHNKLDAVSGCLLTADGTTLTVAAAAGTDAVNPHGRRLEPDEYAAFTATEPFLLSGDTPLCRELLGDVTSGLAVPLLSRDGLVGVVLLGDDRFDDTRREVAAALASQGMSAYANAALFTRVQQLATTDELTRVNNRRHFYALAGALVNDATRDGQPLAAAMLDIDKFKNINDTYGHGVGDDVIREVAKRMSGCLRAGDVVGRYGGEEFAAILTGPDLDGPALAEQLRQAVAVEPVPTRDGPVPVTISIGLTHLRPGDSAVDDLLTRADQALYRAKEGGRNRVEQE